jgi:hypothetical protein
MAKAKNPKLDPELVKMITGCVIDKLSDEHQKMRAAQNDTRLRNTRLLLRHYREMLAHSESSIYDATYAADEDLRDIMDLMSGAESLRVESIRASAVRTRIIVDHVREALDIFQILAERSKKPEELRRCRIVRALYIDDGQRTVDEVAEAESVDARTVYRDVEAACERLTALIFGIDGLTKLTEK